MATIQMLGANELISDSFQKINNNFSELNTAIENKTFDIDDALSLTSTNPVQNKVVTEALANVEVDTATNSEIDAALNLAEIGVLPENGVVPVSMGGTGATTIADARTNLGVSATNNASFTGTTMVQTLTVSSALNIPGGSIWIE